MTRKKELLEENQQLREAIATLESSVNSLEADLWSTQENLTAMEAECQRLIAGYDVAWVVADMKTEGGRKTRLPVPLAYADHTLDHAQAVQWWDALVKVAVDLESEALTLEVAIRRDGASDGSS